MDVKQVRRWPKSQLDKDIAELETCVDEMSLNPTNIEECHELPPWVYNKKMSVHQFIG